MKGTDEKVVAPERNKATKLIPTAKQPSQPINKHTQEFKRSAATGTQHKEKPEEWRSGQPTEHQNEERSDEEAVEEVDDVDNIETEPSTL